MASELAHLRSFQHCRKDVDLVCFRLPEICPLCGQSTSIECRIPPYVLPCPLSSSREASYSVVIKPTQGSFLRDYSSTCNLHIGVTDRFGFVYDFDEDGVHCGSVWPDCLVVMSCHSGQSVNWDPALNMFCRQPSWNKSRYRENEWNCFDFVFEFLRYVRHPDVIPDMTRTTFCNTFILGKTKTVEGYVNLYRQAWKTGCVVVSKRIA